MQQAAVVDQTVEAGEVVVPRWFQEATLDAVDRGVRFTAMMHGTGAGKTWWQPRYLGYVIQQDLENGVADGASYLVIGRTYTMTTDILIPEYEKCFGATNLRGRYRPAREIYELPTGGTIYFRSADKPLRIEGHHCRAVLLDEPSDMPALIWPIVQARSGLYRCPVLFTGYPTNMGWYYESIQKPFEAGDPDYLVFAGPSTDNPDYSPEEMARAERTMPPWMYKMRYWGEFQRPAGLVYPKYGESCFVDPFPIPADWPTYVVVDPAVQFGALFFAWHRGHYYIYNEYYEVELVGARRWAAAMKPKLEGINQGWVYDPARKTDVASLGDYGCGPFYMADNSVDAGIVTLTGLIADGRFHVMRGRAPVFHDQMSKYRYPTDPATGRILDRTKPIKKDDHLPDCARYLAQTLEGSSLEERLVVVAEMGEPISPY